VVPRAEPDELGTYLVNQQKIYNFLELLGVFIFARPASFAPAALRCDLVVTG